MSLYGQGESSDVANIEMAYQLEEMFFQWAFDQLAASRSVTGQMSWASTPRQIGGERVRQVTQQNARKHELPLGKSQLGPYDREIDEIWAV